ncbi:dTDP-4-dehydrorhamnose 3,5-epimerase [Taibaiella sp. KBW10]|uniref:dTDP-4-dehydrorhamnose 3,5-epimerase family protein n=1 Tax=Taibaiella sp. KBW10 TaxID=2153357 RepID=UPI000F5AD725|nr:dTDP-4-dehydrorhamnose 3,5-epimerase family protein [Taibaiella sp. KBW10]RQO32461.1 dTDP-4-dehydrorhamnose 3,5-epimerase [Taibaiella sp. KBW10]
MDFTPLGLAGARLLTLPRFLDHRGSFVKAFNEGAFLEQGITFETKESYFSYSNKEVIRGMHFQLPPYQHAKVVFCPKGAILDVILDLRKGSATYGHFEAHILSEENHQAYYIPEGFAHGFKALEDDSLTYYLVSSVHEPKSDTGIRFDSFGMDWACAAPVVSDRDKSFVAFADFDSPF